MMTLVTDSASLLVASQMKTENLIKACDSFDVFLSELREAHTDAVNIAKGRRLIAFYGE
jgi:hypothetical protein